MTAVLVLCSWDGWVEHTGSDLSWKVDACAALDIKDGKKVIATHAPERWLIVKDNS